MLTSLALDKNIFSTSAWHLGPILCSPVNSFSELSPCFLFPFFCSRSWLSLVLDAFSCPVESASKAHESVDKDQLSLFEVPAVLTWPCLPLFVFSCPGSWISPTGCPHCMSSLFELCCYSLSTSRHLISLFSWFPLMPQHWRFEWALSQNDFPRLCLLWDQRAIWNLSPAYLLLRLC